MNKPQISQTQYSFIFRKFSFFITNSLAFYYMPRFWNASNTYFLEILIIWLGVTFVFCWEK